ncbi:hypothetical protein [Massilia sp. DWR3-1-1]|uniref:hypothetical protein n=1 Tax=Massilia sp. DWR3-1-1 TaxID=2804559 RepID=UPI003CF99E7F
MRSTALFHLAFPVHDLDAARRFYGGLIGCAEGRSSAHWIDFDFFGHQRLAHLAPDECDHVATSTVDGHQVPARPPSASPGCRAVERAGRHVRGAASGHHVSGGVAAHAGGVVASGSSFSPGANMSMKR